MGIDYEAVLELMMFNR